MNLTDYHAKYFAHELTKRHSADELEKLAGTLVDAQVDLNPHQIDAALFAFRSPLSKGAILADEVDGCPRFLSEQTDNEKQQLLQTIDQRNANFFEEEITKLDAWADDRKVALEREIKEFDKRIKEARRSARATATLDEKLAAQKEVKMLEKDRTRKRRALFTA